MPLTSTGKHASWGPSTLMSASRIVHTGRSPASESSAYSDSRGTIESRLWWIVASMLNAVDSSAASRRWRRADHCAAPHEPAVTSTAPATIHGVRSRRG